MAATPARGGRLLPALADCLLCALVAGTLLGAREARALPPEVGWRLLPGDGDGSEDAQSASQGPLGASRTNSLPGLSSSGAASAGFGSLSVRTETSVDAAQNSGESFCFPIVPAPSCSEAEAWWADQLELNAPGLATPGTPGSFTAQVSIDGSLAADTPNDASWQLVAAESDYQVEVSLDGSLVETIVVSCIAIPLTSLACIPVPLQILYGDNPQQKTPAGPFGSFDLGPYDFTWGQPFDFEVRLAANTSMNSEGQTSGTATASVDLENTLRWDGVGALFDGAGGTGASIPLGSALVDPASGEDWLGGIALPEPTAGPLGAVALAAVGALRTARCRRRLRGLRSTQGDRRRA